MTFADFQVIPQLISKKELMYVLSKRTLGKELRRRRDKHKNLASLVKQEDEELRRLAREAAAAPPHTNIETASSNRSVSSHMQMSRQIREEENAADVARIALRKSRLEQLRGVLRELDKTALNAKTTTESLMEHTHWEFSYTEMLEVFARIALFAFSKPALARSRVGMTSSVHTESNALLPTASTSSLLPGGEWLSPEDKLLRLIRYTGFDDVKGTRHKIRTVGAATQMYLNAPAKDKGPVQFLGNASAMEPKGKKISRALQLASEAEERGEAGTVLAVMTAETSPPSSSRLKAAAAKAETSPRPKSHMLQCVIDADGSVIDTRYNMLSPSSLGKPTTPMPGAEEKGEEELADSLASAAIGLEIPTSAGSTRRKGASWGVFHSPEDAAVVEYSHGLLDVLRRYEYDHNSSVYKEFGGPFIDCGTIVQAHALSLPVTEHHTPPTSERAFHYRLNITNECTDVLAVQVTPTGLPSAMEIKLLKSKVPIPAISPRSMAGGRSPQRATAQFIKDKWTKDGAETIMLPSSVTVLDLAPGLNVTVELIVRPPTSSMEILGSINISCTSIGDESQSMDIPIYAKFEPALVKHVAPITAVRRSSVDLRGPDASFLTAAPVSPASPAPLNTGTASTPSLLTPASPTKSVAPMVKRGISFRQLQTGSTSRPSVTTNAVITSKEQRSIPEEAFESTATTQSKVEVSEDAFKQLENIPLLPWDPAFGVSAEQYRAQYIKQEKKRLENTFKAKNPFRDMSASFSATKDLSDMMRAPSGEMQYEALADSIPPSWPLLRSGYEVSSSSKRRIEVEALELTMRRNTFTMSTTVQNKRRPIMLAKPSTHLPAGAATSMARTTAVRSLEAYLERSLPCALPLHRPDLVTEASLAALPTTRFRDSDQTMRR
jgi:hypothetical protein